MDELTKLAQRCAVLLIERGWTLGLAESCTGGMIGNIITNLPGSSAYFVGSVVSYADRIKRDLLHVPDGLIRSYGVVSEPVARAMAGAARRVLDVDVALAVTGIAGPTGGTPEKPVGTVYIGIATPSGQDVRHFVSDGDRLENKRYSTRAALQLLLDMLQADVG